MKANVHGMPVAIEPPSARTRAGLGDFVDLVRPSQWIKNVVVFAGPAAGLKLTDRAALWQAALAFVAFCLAASGTYAINDALDHSADQRHPTKRNRPVARGAISVMAAWITGIVLVIGALLLTMSMRNRSVMLVVGAYFALTLLYSLALKSWILVDVIVIATGFVLRAWAGSLAVGVQASEWLVACMFTLCLFLGFGKRRCEVAMMGQQEDAALHRSTLIRYTPDLLNHLITVSAGVAVMTFLLYVMDSKVHPAIFPREQLFFTLPIVVYGIFRFAMVTELGVYSGPTEIVLRDRPLSAAILLWAGAALIVVYQYTIIGPKGISGLLRALELFTGST